MSTIEISKEKLQELIDVAEKLENENKSLKELIANPTKKRDEVPDFCVGKIQKFEIGGISGYIHCGEYADGRPGQIFLNVGKEGSLSKGLGDAFARVLSIALQHGVPLEDIVRTLRDLEFFPSGPVKRVKGINGAKSIPDLISKYLYNMYLKRSEQQKPKEYGILCPECKTNNMILKAQGCNNICKNCGYIEIGGCGS
jgi:hypothetical protein